ncbi:MAG: DNA topoisomerase IV subunit A [SAR324 cluster bacterium]|nr:DNA topoisomerase IV subunit A [SAR324 cluster bacterium]
MQYLKPLMDKNFLEYASYVIKDRAIPHLDDGLKPVQRRILYTMMKMDDGKFHKVANIIGDTMKLHPHGDASISAALVVIANKEYFIEKQGNFGNLYTGDPASAPRYIEARLTPLAKEVLFNPELTEMEDSYDGRTQEPLELPSKIPGVLLLGSEGIAVGMATSILPHNFNEVLNAQIAFLRHEPFELYPDFLTGGEMDVSQYQDGNGKVKVRARIEVSDEKTVVIREVPAGMTTEMLINSIQEAANKGKLKIASITDYTTDAVEIEVKAARGVKAESLLQPLYAFTHCEISLSNNLLVIAKQHPVQMTVTSVLQKNTNRLLHILEAELQLDLRKTEQKWHEKKLQALFIAHRIYQHLEDSENYQEALNAVTDAFLPFHHQFKVPISEENIEKLLNIPIQRIAKFDLEKNYKELKSLEKEIRRIRRELKDITQYAINYLNGLLEKYGSQFSRRTKISTFEDIKLKDIALINQKVGWDPDTGYLGTVVKGEIQFVCSPYDRLVIFQKDGAYHVVRVPEKLFIGTHVQDVAKVSSKTVFNLIYFADSSKVCYAKRFVVKGFILDKEYELFPKIKGAKIAHLSTGNGVVVEIQYVPAPRLKKLKEEYAFDKLSVKGIGTRGNRISTKAVRRTRDLNRRTNIDEVLVESEQLELIADQESK